MGVASGEDAASVSVETQAHCRSQDCEVTPRTETHVECSLTELLRQAVCLVMADPEKLICPNPLGPRTSQVSPKCQYKQQDQQFIGVL